MHFSSISTLVSIALLLTIPVSGHGVVTAVKGANGKNGVGFGVTDVTGTKPHLFNQATRYLKGDTSACGAQKLNGKNFTAINQDAELNKAINNGLPTAAADGTISMTLFQVNSDGAGPYHCEVSEDATGKTFKAIDTTKQVPGVKSKSNAKKTPFPMAVKLPAGTKCTGPSGACLIRCKNENARPFGGCFAVAQETDATPKRDSITRLIHEARYNQDVEVVKREQTDEEEDADDVDPDGPDVE